MVFPSGHAEQFRYIKQVLNAMFQNTGGKISGKTSNYFYFQPSASSHSIKQVKTEPLQSFVNCVTSSGGLVGLLKCFLHPSTEGRSLNTGSLLPLMTLLSKLREKAAFNISISSSVFIFNGCFQSVLWSGFLLQIGRAHV